MLIEWIDFFCKNEVKVSVECEGGWFGGEWLILGVVVVGNGLGWWLGIRVGFLSDFGRFVEYVIISR